MATLRTLAGDLPVVEVPVLDDDLWATLEDLRSEGKVKHLGVALGPAIGWVEEGLEAIRRRPICSLQTVYNIIEQEPGRTFVDESVRLGSNVGMISRVPHASDSLSGKVERDTKFPAGDHRAHRNRDNMLDNFDKADTLSFLWEGTGRTKGQAAIAGILADPLFTTVLPTCVNVAEVEEYNTDGPVSVMLSKQSYVTPRGTTWGRIDVYNFGPGYSKVWFSGIVDAINIATTTPIDEERSVVRFNFTVRKFEDAALTSTVAEAFVKEINKQVVEDTPIWEHKTFLPVPALADTDGPILKFRKWYSQFYAEPVAGA